MLADTGTFYSVDLYDGEWALEHGDARGLAGRHDAQAARSRRSAPRRSSARPSSAASGSSSAPTAGSTRTGSNGAAVRLVHPLRDDAARRDPSATTDGRRRVPGLVGPGRLAGGRPVRRPRRGRRRPARGRDGAGATGVVVKGGDGRRRAGSPVRADRRRRGRIVVDGRPIERAGRLRRRRRSLRAGEPPGRGGTLCLAGDCGNCLASSTAWRTSGRARAGARRARSSSAIRSDCATRHCRRPDDATRPPRSRSTPRGRRRVVGRSAPPGRGAVDAARCIVLDAARAGDEVVAIYAGPTVVARTDRRDAPRRGRARSSSRPGPRRSSRSCPGNDLRGILTPRAPRATPARWPASSCPSRSSPVGRRGRVRFEGDDRGASTARS